MTILVPLNKSASNDFQLGVLNNNTAWIVCQRKMKSSVLTASSLLFYNYSVQNFANGFDIKIHQKVQSEF